MPVPWGAIATVAGSILQSRSDRSTNQSNAALQREFARYGIRWKVEDAKAAGLHPLYAIGAITPSAQASYQSPQLGAGLAQAGRQLDDWQQARARDAQRTADRRAMNLNQSRRRKMMMDMHILEQQRLQSQIRVDNAQVNYFNALAAAARSDSNNANDGATSIETRSEDLAPVTGVYKPDPPKVPITKKDDPTKQAGPAGPAWETITVFKDPRIPKPLRTIDVPQSDEGWAEDFVQKIPVIAAANAARYYKWLTKKEIASMYMTPYGRARMIVIAGKKAPAVYGRVVRALRNWHAKRSKKHREGLQYGP